MEDCQIEAKYTPELGALVSDPAKSLQERYRALFTLKSIGGFDAIEAIAKCFSDISGLFKHECAYCLGQLQDVRAIPILSSVLEDESQDIIVRHEAGEALGAIGSPESKELLMKYISDPRPELSETCQIALDLITWRATGETVLSKNPYSSVDPAPPSAKQSTPELRSKLLDTKLSLFERYRALFSLRNRGTEECVTAIVAGLKDSSALFRHEMAYVLGQMQHPASIPGLSEGLDNPLEHPMVRHECAEALGAIATEECLPVLRKYAADTELVVRESCMVALDMHEYENSEQFQYADGLSRVL